MSIGMAGLKANNVVAGRARDGDYDVDVSRVASASERVVAEKAVVRLTCGVLIRLDVSLQRGCAMARREDK
jgi:hypothetical protein